jgi:Fe-S cluster biogenesis protein NfuA
VLILLRLHILQEPYLVFAIFKNIRLNKAITQLTLHPNFSSMESNKVPVAIYAESTPNPATMKFVASIALLPAGASVEFTSAEETTDAPLAARLFSFPFVTGVFIASNFITLTKNDLVEWQEVFGEIREYITNYLLTGHPVFSDDFAKNMSNKEGSVAQTENETEQVNTAAVSPQNEMEEKIVNILEEYVRPAVESDGGAIEFNNYAEGKLTVVLKGACSGCPSSTMTLKNGIQGLFDQMLPEVKEVVALEG